MSSSGSDSDYEAQPHLNNETIQPVRSSNGATTQPTSQPSNDHNHAYVNIAVAFRGSSKLLLLLLLFLALLHVVAVAVLLLWFSCVGNVF